MEPKEILGWSRASALRAHSEGIPGNTLKALTKTLALSKNAKKKNLGKAPNPKP